MFFLAAASRGVGKPRVLSPSPWRLSVPAQPTPKPGNHLPKATRHRPLCVPVHGFSSLVPWRVTSCWPHDCRPALSLAAPPASPLAVGCQLLPCALTLPWGGGSFLGSLPQPEGAHRAFRCLTVVLASQLHNAYVNFSSFCCCVGAVI